MLSGHHDGCKEIRIQASAVETRQDLRDVLTLADNGKFAVTSARAL
jgi:hypothetical protein